ncbi:uncharacterized protein LOC142088584 [Calonectris borealis]|uniref:uncharacterized protein LOC142088584 n=1 Tax=Calonectris borealis TaxID=1323832 RepID=UPI003F4B02C8
MVQDLLKLLPQPVKLRKMQNMSSLGCCKLSRRIRSGMRQMICRARLAKEEAEKKGQEGQQQRKQLVGTNAEPNQSKQSQRDDKRWRHPWGNHGDHHLLELDLAPGQRQKTAGPVRAFSARLQPANPAVREPERITASQRLQMGPWEEVGACLRARGLCLKEKKTLIAEGRRVAPVQPQAAGWAGWCWPRSRDSLHSNLDEPGAH